MLLLLVIGFAAGVVTAISPCVVPVLPLVLGGAAGAGRRKPYAIVAGLVVSFTVFTLFATAILEALGLPKDFLRNLALALLLLVAAGLVFPRLGHLLERPFARFGRRRPGETSSGFALGLSLGLVYVPCAGPVLAAVSVKAAENEVGWQVAGLMTAYALGASLPLLAVALAGQRATERTRALREHALGLRRAAGVVLAAAALAIAFHLDEPFTTAVPGYTASLQNAFEENARAERELAELRGGTERLADFGPAPDFTGIEHWLNTPGGRPLPISALRGKVVLVDFWTYSCINCLRTLPHLKAWYATYHKRGLELVGVHTPEFAFEHELGNVRRAVKRLGLRYPVALDNDYDTWRAYANQYWPSKYLIDRGGQVRFAHFGEGAYEETERVIQRLLGEPAQRPPVSRAIPDSGPRSRPTPESYLGYARVDRLVGDRGVQDRFSPYRLPRSIPLHHLAYGGTWRVERERIVAGPSARLRLHFRAQRVFLVLAGDGRVSIRVDGRPRRAARIRGDRLYTLLRLPRVTDATLELGFSPGLAAYAFTFG